ncbi:MAG: hypothetical protein IMZ65_04185 [Planctomycetes bacterium]|nr:hypothetical protein [Planctomycetota bacterium]
MAVEFPRTMIENLSVSRLVMGTNWWLGYSHTSGAKDREIRRTCTAERVAEMIQVYLDAGVDTMLGPLPLAHLKEAIEIAQDKTGKKVLYLVTPSLNIAGDAKADDESRRAIDECAKMGAPVCMPHTSSTDALVDRRARVIRDMDKFCRMIREAGMIPGLSTHMPEAPVYADETGLDVGTYVQIYNAVGFLMQIEVDWVHRMIWQCKKPVITIKPLAVNKVMPLVGLAFNWSTIRDQDMVCVGTTTPDEVREIIEISLSLLERRTPEVQLQRTRSKASVEPKKK